MNKENLLPEDNQISDYLEQTLQKMDPYSTENGNNFYPWLDYFEYVVGMIKVPNNKIIKIFNRMIDDEIQRNVENFFSPITFSELSYDLLIYHYLYYFYLTEPPKINMIRFKNRNQYEAETIEIYANSLQKIIGKCNLKNESEKMLIKRFIEGLNNNKFKAYIKRHFVVPFKETVKKVISIARALNKYTCECDVLEILDIYSHGNADLFCMWLNRFEFAQDLNADLERNMLRNFNELIDIDLKTYIQKYYDEINFSELSYVDTVNLYLRFYKDPDEPNLHRKRFYNRTQFEHESIEGYAKRLKNLYNMCNFNDSLEEILTEQFAKGLLKNQIRDLFERRNHLLFVDVLSFAIKFEKYAATINYEIPHPSIIDVYKPQNEGTFWDWLNKFRYKVENFMVGRINVLEIFNKKISNDLQEKVKQANSDIDFSEILYEDTITLYLYYFASADETDVYRKLFLCRNQYERENITKYADDLCVILSKCNFTGNREQILIEKFINGLNDNEMKNTYKRISCKNIHQFLQITPFLEQFQKLTSYLNSALSRMKTFHPENGEEFYLWLNKFEYMKNMFGVPNHKIVEFFEYMIDHDVHTLVKKANSSSNFTILRYDELIDYYLRFYASPGETDLHLKRFLCRNQYENEPLNKYFVALCLLYKKCNTLNHFEDRLSERFRNGVFDDKLRNHLSNCHGLTFETLLAKAFVFAKENSKS